MVVGPPTLPTSILKGNRNGLSNLTLLSLGHSPITPTSPPHIASYLLQLLPPNCKIGGPLWTSALMRTHTQTRMQGKTQEKRRLTSKMAVRRQPAGSGLTMMSCVSYSRLGIQNT